MNREQIYEFMNKTGMFFLATNDAGRPRVRGMMLYSAGADGIIFHTGAFKDLYKQLQKDQAAELCFYDGKSNTQVRVSGTLQFVEDIEKKKEIINHPSRQFLQGWKNSLPEDEFFKQFIVFKLESGRAVVWTMALNNQPKEEIKL